MNQHYQALMRAATQLTRVGQLHEATQLIQRALNGGNQDIDKPDLSENGICVHSEVLIHDSKPGKPGITILDACGIEIEVAPEIAPEVASTVAPDSASKLATAFGAVNSSEGKFIDGRHSHGALTRNYKLFVPTDLRSAHAGHKRPLVVMLHGCTQDPNDFAIGTNMNEQARQHGLLVLYPEQSGQANPSRCWNWFKHNHQRRGSGEPALLASMTQAVIKEYDLDAQRVYIAGLSAGGAMAAIMADAYPDVYAAAGIHSGLAAGTASNVSEAMAAMKTGSGSAGTLRGSKRDAARPSAGAVATIVFHGDRDTTVHPGNGKEVLQAMLASVTPGSASSSQSVQRDQVRIEKGVSSRGRAYTRTIHCDQKGGAHAEHWLVHGAGHAWSGGRSGGSFTDPTGPDATGEMLRFFLAQPPLAPRQ